MKNGKDLLFKHRILDHDCRNKKGKIFISDWYCEHPFGMDIIQSDLLSKLEDGLILPYYFQNDSASIHQEIISFHLNHNERQLTLDEIFVTSGLTPLMTAQILMLVRKGVKKIYYINPLYYAYFFLAESFGVELVPCNSSPILENEEHLILPKDSHQWLVLCDPIWFIGKSINSNIINKLVSWQKRTGGKIIVDGAFQYQRWEKNFMPEASSLFIPDQTIRNLCPTKTVAIHGPRFAYSIIPKKMREELRYCYSNIMGSGSCFDSIASLSIMKWLNDEKSNDKLIKFTNKRYKTLVSYNLIKDNIGSEATYFCFVEIPVSNKKLIVMDQSFFNITCYPNEVRFNILLHTHELFKYVKLACVNNSLYNEIINLL